MQVLGLMCIKMSFIFFYVSYRSKSMPFQQLTHLFKRRIFVQGSSKVFDILTLVALAIIAAWGLAYFFSLLLMCPGHPDAFWTTLAEEKKYCFDTTMWHNSYGISDVVLDFIVILIPIPQVVQLHMSGSRKLAVLGVFSLGAFSIVASILRMVTYLQSTKVEFEPGTDTDSKAFTHTFNSRRLQFANISSVLITGVIYWAVVESGIALISCCLPTIHSFTRRKISQRSTSGPNSTQGYTQRSAFRRSILRKQGYREEKNSTSSDALELTNIAERTEPAAHSVARAGGNPVRTGDSSDENILVTRTFEIAVEPANREGSIV